jgi:hypothetical protein
MPDVDLLVLSGDAASLAVNPEWLQALQNHALDPETQLLIRAEPGNDAHRCVRLHCSFAPLFSAPRLAADTGRKKQLRRGKLTRNRHLSAVAIASLPAVAVGYCSYGCG